MDKLNFKLNFIRSHAQKIVLALFCLALPLFLMLLSYKTILFFTDLTADQQNTIAYLQGKEDLKPDYSGGEISHLDDVKKVMAYLNYLFYGLMLALTLILTHHKKNREELLRLFSYGGIATISAVLMIFLLSLASFNEVFTVFHQLFFPQGNWIFPADSLLIRTFPITFFITISKNIFLLSLFFGIVFISIKYPLNYVRRSRA
ncbi:MAG: DUF1461 domain-containing protein [Nanoarchaeota archaeon]